MERLYLHLGYSKTGTTSVQLAFQTNREMLLADHSFLYPEACIAHPELGHHNIGWQLLDSPRFRKKNGTIDDLADELTRSGARNALISSESLVGLIRDQPERFRQLVENSLNFCPKTLIVTLRRIDEVAESLFRHLCSAWTRDRQVPFPPAAEKYFSSFNVEHYLKPLAWLLKSGLECRYLVYGPDMVARLVAVTELEPAVCEQLKASKLANRTWMSNRALALIALLDQHPDVSTLKAQVSAQRQPFMQVLRSLRTADSHGRLVTKAQAQALQKRARPYYEAVGKAFSEQLFEPGPFDDRPIGSMRTRFTQAEIARVNDFFGANVLQKNRWYWPFGR